MIAKIKTKLRQAHEALLNSFNHCKNICNDLYKKAIESLIAKFNILKKSFRKNIQGRYILCLKKAKNIKRKAFKSIRDFWDNHLKEFLSDLWRLPLHVIKTMFTKNLVINISLLIIYLFLIKYLASPEKLQGVLISVFTALNLTNGYLSYSKSKEDKLLAHPFLIEVLNIFSLFGYQISYFRTFGLANNIYHAHNASAKNILLTGKTFFKYQVKAIKQHLENDFDSIGNFYIYYGFVRFMEENVQHFITLNETLIPNAIKYINSPTTKCWLAHLQRVLIYLLKKYQILISYQSDIQIKQIQATFYQMVHEPREISIENLEQDRKSQDDKKNKILEQFNFGTHESLKWKFEIDDLKKDIIFLLEILLQLYPDLITTSGVKQVKENTGTIPKTA